MYFLLYHFFIIHISFVDNVDNSVYNLYLRQNQVFFMWITYFSTFSVFRHFQTKLVQFHKIFTNIFLFWQIKNLTIFHTVIQQNIVWKIIPMLYFQTAACAWAPQTALWQQQNRLRSAMKANINRKKNAPFPFGKEALCAAYYAFFIKWKDNFLRKSFWLPQVFCNSHQKSWFR